MLKFFRKHASGWFMSAVIGIIIIVFVLYFGSSRGGRHANVVAKVDKKLIGDGEFYKEYERLLDMARLQFGAQLTPEMIKKMNLKQTAFDNLLNRQIIIAKADDLKIQVSEEELRSSIMSMPMLQKNGAFDERTYQQVLRYNRMTPEEFESLQKADLTAKKIELLIRDGIKISPQEIHDFYVLQNQKINLRFVKISGDDLRKSIAPTRQELEDYLKSNGNAFRVPEQIKLKYLFFSADSFAPNIPEADVKDYYNSNRQNFKAKDGRLLSLAEAQASIVQELQKSRGKMNAYAEAKKARETIYQEDNLDAYAGKNNFRVHATDYFPINKIPTELAGVKNISEALVDLQLNDLSKILTTDNGYYLLKIVDKKAAYVPKLADIENDVRKQYIETQSRVLAEKEAQAVLEKIKAGESLETIARQKKLTVGETGLFQPGNNIPKVGSHKDALEVILQMSPNRPYSEKPLFINNAYFIFKLLEVQKPDEKEFEAQKAIYEKALLAMKKEEAFRTWVEGNKIEMIKEKRVRIIKQVDDL
jgi:peptidyl-prolyl cis-trans isomerase D